MDIVWEDPPERAILRAAGGGRYIDFALALREYPGKWAVLPSDEERSEKGAKATAQNIKRGRVRGFPAGEYETAVDGTKVYVRFKEAVPKDEDSENDDPDEIDDEDQEEPYPPISAGPTPEEPHAARVRAWAIQQGMKVPDRGRLPRHITEKYQEAHPPRKKAVQ